MEGNVTESAVMTSVAILQTELTPYRMTFFESLSRALPLPVKLVQYGSTQRPRRQWIEPDATDAFEVRRVRHASLATSYEKTYYVPWALGRELTDIDPAVVVGAFDTASLLASQWCARRGRPFVVWSEEHEASLAALSWQRLRRRVRVHQLRRATGLLVPGSLSAGHSETMGYDGPVEFVPNAIRDEADFEEIGRQRTRDAQPIGDEYRFLFAGSLLARKGIDLLVENWPAMTEGLGRRAVLDVAGTGPYEFSTGRSVPGVRFHGHVSGEVYRKLFAGAHALVLPARYDPNPLVVVEALWAGLPLILSEATGNWPEAVKENGVVARAGDLDSLRQAIGDLAGSDDATQHAREAASVRIAPDFSLARATTGFTSLVAHIRGAAS